MNSLTCLGTLWHCCLGTFLKSSSLIEGVGGRKRKTLLPALLSWHIVANLARNVLTNLLLNSHWDLKVSDGNFICNGEYIVCNGECVASDGEFNASSEK